MPLFLTISQNLCLHNYEATKIAPDLMGTQGGVYRMQLSARNTECYDFRFFYFGSIMPEEAAGSNNTHLKFSTCILLKLSVFTKSWEMFHKIMKVSMAAFSQLTFCGRIFLSFFCAEVILIAARNLLSYWQRRQIPTLKKFCIMDNIILFVPIVQRVFANISF